MWGDSESASKNTSMCIIEKFSERVYKKKSKNLGERLSETGMTLTYEAASILNSPIPSQATNDRSNLRLQILVRH